MQASPDREPPRPPAHSPAHRLGDLLLAAWAAFAFTPLVVFHHSTFRISSGQWVFASLDPGAELFSWTRNRLLLFVLLWITGWVLLVQARRRDPDETKLRAFAYSRCAIAVLLVGAASTASAAALMDATATPIVMMLLTTGFAIAWRWTRDGPALVGVLARASLLLGSLILVGWCAEAVMRLPRMTESTGGSDIHRASLRGRAHLNDGGSHPIGWRTRRDDFTARDDRPRIFALGDSFTYGDFVEDVDDLWTSVLEDELAASGHGVEVINTGAAGSNTVYQRELLAAIGWLYDPEAIVVQFTLNDAAPPASRQTVPLLPVFGTSLSQKSALFQFLDTRFRGYQVGARYRDWWSDHYEPDAPGWVACREALDSIGRQARERGIPAVLLLFPMFDSNLSEDAYWNLSAHEAIRVASQAAGLEFIDLRPLLAEIDSDPRAWWVRPFDSHPGVGAHRVAGQAVARKLRALQVF